MRTETVRLAEAFDSVRTITKQLDPTNVTILWTMWKVGPRNLLKTARKTGMPFTSVYRRVEKLEARSGRLAYLIPRLSTLGMTRVVVLVAAKIGYEQEALLALKIPNLWRSINSCEGHFTYHSVQAVPINCLRDFTNYMRRLLKLGIVTRMVMIRTGEQYPNFPDFKYFDFKRNEWTLPWGKWMGMLEGTRPSDEELDPSSCQTLADKRDLIIIKELEKNARKSFAEIADVVGISLQAVKQRFDRKLVPNGMVQNFAMDVTPYPMEVSAYHEIMLEFTSELALRKFFAIRDKLFFILGASKVIRQNSLLIRTCILDSQVPKMFKFFSEMAREGILGSYSALRLTLENRETQTISYELFDDMKGWTFNLRQCVMELAKLSKPRRLASRTVKTSRF
jgi:DNA-binding Lrp family transcriptional regulator